MMSNVKIFTDNIEGSAVNQVYTLVEQEAFKDSKVRIMPDVHSGAGCVIGFTADLGDRVIPNVVGVDIGCGMLTVEFGKVDIDLEKLDGVIKKVVPHGFNIHNRSSIYSSAKKMPFDVQDLKCYNELRNKDNIEVSLGTLGGGNHFIEVDKDDEDNKYLIIHTGSRNLGKQVADIYQNKAISLMNKYSKEDRDEVIRKLKSENRQSEIPDALKALTPEVKVPKDLSYLEGQNRLDYLHDMRLCQVFAYRNREMIAEKIMKEMNLTETGRFQTIHNYIGDDNIVRKGAISAYKDEIVLIPINMRDGCIIARGLGNEDWNFSAPHGAGRIMSRRSAKDNLDLDEFTDDMKDIYTTTANLSTLDESPRAYKPMDEILENIKDTVEVIKIIKPIYNFKAAE
jgi:RNA-splicing ligase RtcB